MNPSGFIGCYPDIPGLEINHNKQKLIIDENKKY